MTHTPAERWSLAAYGRADDVEVELDASHDDTRWSLQLAFGMVRLGLAAERTVLHELRTFLADTFRTGVYRDAPDPAGGWRAMPEKSLRLGTAGGVEVRLHKDGEYDDRYFLIPRLADGHLVVTLTLDQTVALIAAVDAALADLGP